MTRFLLAVIRAHGALLFTLTVLGSSAAQAQNMLAAAMEDSQSPGQFNQAMGNSPDLGMNSYSGGNCNNCGNGNGNCGGNCGCQNCNGCGCGGCGCDGCSACGANGCCSKWYVQGGAVFLWRNNDSVNQPVVVSSIDPTLTLLDTHDTGFDTGIGPRILVGFRTNACESWSVNYFSAFDFSGDATLTSQGSLAAPGTLGQLGTDWSFSDQMTIQYTSEINNVEINHMRNWGDVSFLAGFRFLDLSENYNITTVSGADTSFYNVRTLNDLYGFQIGGRYRHCCHRFFWDFTGKAGVFGNAAEQGQYLSDNGNTTVYRDNTESHMGTVAFIGDLNLSVGFQLTKVWAARCGYNLMWIDQVALCLTNWISTSLRRAPTSAPAGMCSCKASTWRWKPHW